MQGVVVRARALLAKLRAVHLPHRLREAAHAAAQDRALLIVQIDVGFDPLLRRVVGFVGARCLYTVGLRVPLQPKAAGSELAVVRVAEGARWGSDRLEGRVKGIDNLLGIDLRGSMERRTWMLQERIFASVRAG